MSKEGNAQMSDNKMVALLKKMIAHEKSARSIGNIAEAEAFAAKIQNLLLSHKLEMTDLEVEAQKTEDPFGKEQHGVNYGSTPQWRITLASAIARSFFCKAFYIAGMNKIQFVGRTSDRAATIQMYEYLGELGKSIGAEEWKVARAQFGYSVSFKAKWDKSFRQGYADAISQRLRKDQYDLTAVNPNAFALVRREEVALEAYVKDTMRIKTGVGRKQDGNFDAYAKGKAHGANVSLKSKTALGSGS